ncbi:GMP synthase [glutamine-hydrolyzing] subunit B [Halolamina pelagica]|uniref:GMP synthetase n=1 Tax=Halolamina pelagica TaxID=699431 RepID=A0A0N8HZH3_9EURY|nr:GMP synthase [glutamine-hydrolyzing] subunit B [Halolamina pelagica]
MVDAESFIEEKVEEIRDEVGDGKAVIALSGGVDSSVAAALAYEAIGDRLVPVYVDTGLMRKGETESIRETFSYMHSLTVVDAENRFLAELAGVTDPEEKRHVIGEQFIREFEREAREADADYLVQGPSTPTGSRARGTSSPTTTSAACRRPSTSRGSSSQCATSTRTRSARWLANSISRRSSPSGCRSRARGWRSASSAR